MRFVRRENHHISFGNRVQASIAFAPPVPSDTIDQQGMTAVRWLRIETFRAFGGIAGSRDQHAAQKRLGPADGLNHMRWQHDLRLPISRGTGGIVGHNIDHNARLGIGKSRSRR